MCIENLQGNSSSLPISSRNHHSEKRWYVIRSIGRRECKVKEHIETMMKRDANFAKYVSQVIVPMEEKRNNRNGKTIVTKKPLISGYIYVEAELADRIQSMLCSVLNVLGFLNYSKTGNKPMPLSPKEVERLLASTGKTSVYIDDIISTLSGGDQLIITDGPFGGFNAYVEEIDKDKSKLKAAVRIFGRRTPLELDFGQVKKI